MHQAKRIVVGIGSLLLVSGCHTATRVSEVPRADLDLSTGNRGYLIGTPPESGERHTTRQMIHTDVEIPSFYKPRRTGKSVRLDEAPVETETTEGLSSPGTFDTYVVQKGDSLWSIAAKPQIYGKATQWRRIFDANRDALKNPERVRPGMTLKIPRGERDEGSIATYGNQGVVYRK